jgi:hypothetical protein
VKGIEYGEYSLPAEVLWIGFDAYNCWDAAECEENGLCCWQNHTIPHYLSVMQRYVAHRPGGKMIVVGDGVATSKPGPTPQLPSAGDQRLRAARDRRYFQWCAAEESCVAMLVFLWASLSAPSAWLIGRRRCYSRCWHR